MADFEIRRLKNGMQVFVRPVRPCDKSCLERGFSQLSETSKYQRFFSHLPRLSENMLKQFTEVDHKDRAALCAGIILPHGWKEAGIIRYTRDPGKPGIAELALIIIDAYQNLGLGSILFESIKRIAIRNGIREFQGYVMPDNLTMIHLLQKWQGESHWEASGFFRYDIKLTDVGSQIAVNG